jgi:hypothetical protein
MLLLVALGCGVGLSDQALQCFCWELLLFWSLVCVLWAGYRACVGCTALSVLLLGTVL